MSDTIKKPEQRRSDIDDPKLYNIGELAVALGVHRDFIKRMKFHGFRMPLGRATVAMAHRWLEANPEVGSQ